MEVQPDGFTQGSDNVREQAELSYIIWTLSVCVYTHVCVCSEAVWGDWDGEDSVPSDGVRQRRLVLHIF